MNKAFVRESDTTADYCPRCGAQGHPVGREAMGRYVRAKQLRTVSDPAAFCPTPTCEVAYFDAFERAILVRDLTQPAYPKDPDAPICACFGLTRRDIEQDVSEGVVTRVRAILAKSQTPAARCAALSANGQCCVAYVQKYYMQCREGKGFFG